MPTSVLLSIRPRFAGAIFDGVKDFEFRRCIYRRRDVQNVWVYASAPVGLVIGVFGVDEILSLRISSLWAHTRHAAGISKEIFDTYFSGCHLGHALAIGQRWRFAEPIPLSALGIARPPQSFQYIAAEQPRIKSVAA
jgi:predicted transcriptional regulator